ncbi:hypothetical protein ABPG72_012977 [Tetrahymena utriculariae]
MQEICSQPFKLDLKCPHHQGYDLIYVQLKLIDGQDNKLFYCSECSDEDADYKSTNFITIQKIMQQNQNQILQKWPILNDNKLLNQINDVINIQNNFDEITEHINSYFKNLLVQVIEKIDEQKEKMLLQIEKIKNYKQDILKQYIDISKIEEVKSIIQSQDLDIEQKKKKYLVLLKQIIKKKDENSQILQNMIQQAKQISKIDCDIPQAQKMQILQDLEKINFFQLQKKNECNTNKNIEESAKVEMLDQSVKSEPKIDVQDTPKQFSASSNDHSKLEIQKSVSNQKQGIYKNILDEINFIQSKLNLKLNKMLIQKISNKEISISTINSSYFTQCYTNTNLQHSKNYIFRFNIKSTDPMAQFAIGLENENQISNKALICDLYCKFDCKDNQLILNEGKISKIAQGSNTLMKCDSSLLELRLSYDKYFIQISDYPETKNKYLHIEPTKKYFQNHSIKLFIYTKSSQLCITLKEAYEVDQFI